MKSLTPGRAREALHKRGPSRPEDIARELDGSLAYTREVLAILKACHLVSKEHTPSGTLYTAYPRPFSHPCA